MSEIFTIPSSHRVSGGPWFIASVMLLLPVVRGLLYMASDAFFSPLVLSETATWKAKCLDARMSSCGQVWAFLFPLSSPRRGQAPTQGRSKNPHPSLGKSLYTSFPASWELPPSLSLTVLSHPSFQARYSVKSTHYVCVYVQECEII